VALQKTLYPARSNGLSTFTKIAANTLHNQMSPLFSANRDQKSLFQTRPTGRVFRDLKVLADFALQVFHGNFTQSSLQIKKVIKRRSTFFTQNAEDGWKCWGSGPTGRPFETKVVNIRKQGRKRWLGVGLCPEKENSHHWRKKFFCVLVQIQMRLSPSFYGGPNRRILTSVGNPRV
jgi:hypothetical protein